MNERYHGTALTEADALRFVARLALLNFFPKEPEARVDLASDLCDFCWTREHAEWLVKRMRTLYNDWPGPKEFRAVYCARHTPKDGIDAWSEKYGVLPSEAEQEERRLLLEGKTPKLLSAIPLPPSHLVPRDKRLEGEVMALAVIRRMPPPEELPNDDPVIQKLWGLGV